MAVVSTRALSTENSTSLAFQLILNSCQAVGSRSNAALSCAMARAAKLRKARESGRTATKGKPNAAGASAREGRRGERKVAAKNPEPGRSSRSARWDWGDAKKNQAALGNAGRRPALPPKPSENPKGSFHIPKPQVPGSAACEERARSISSNGGRCENLRRGMPE